MLLLLALLGCSAPCVPFGDVEVTGGTASQRARVAGALDTFATWTGRDTICVDEVRLEPDPRSGGVPTLGRLLVWRGDVLLREDQPALEETLFHELCHAIDFDEGHTEAVPGLFPYDPTAHDYDLRDAESRARESFALTCEEGPDTLADWQRVVEACEPGVDTRGIAYVREQVFLGEPGQAAPDADLARLLERLPIGETIDGACLGKPLDGGGEAPTDE